MFIFALLIGIYSYIIFALGLVGWLYKSVVIWLTLGFWFVAYHRSSFNYLRSLRIKLHSVTALREKSLLSFFVILLALQALVNLIGALGPELSFDALWYHLTLPKLYLISHSISFFDGGLLYYSAMPKLAELLYVAGLSFGTENIAKLIHYSFGLLTCLAIYKLSRKFFSSLISLIAVVIFYSNLVVGWESTAAYIDLVRAFFEVMALWGFVNWLDGKKKKWLVISALMVGLAITTKLLAVGSLVIFTLLLVAGSKWRVGKTTRYALRAICNVIIYWLIALAVPLPWFVFSYFHTGNPVYPFFTDIYKVIPEPLSVLGFFRDVWLLLTQASDPISLVYIIMLPIIILFFIRHSGLSRISKIKTLRFREILDAARMTTGIGVIGLYSMLALVVWYFTPRTGGGRFILPYLPAFSILCAALIDQVWRDVYLRRFLITVVIFASLFSIIYRFGANSKYLPVILAQETKGEFLAKHLNFAFGDFYDTDNYFAEHIKQDEKVLLYGFHNLYYVDFPFVDSSWVREGDAFQYIAVQQGDLPKEFKNWKLVYENRKTMVKLYRR